MSKTMFRAALAAVLLAALPALAEEMTEGVIRKVNKDAAKLTIKHGEIKHLDMPAMTMVFQVKEPSMLDQVKEGDKVRFAVESKGGAMTVTKIEPAP